MFDQQVLGCRQTKQRSSAWVSVDNDNMLYTLKCWKEGLITERNGTKAS